MHPSCHSDERVSDKDRPSRKYQKRSQEEAKKANNRLLGVTTRIRSYMLELDVEPTNQSDVEGVTGVRTKETEEMTRNKEIMLTKGVASRWLDG
ncbi:hypothetical protein RUM43_001895 [Polyplax serrata]|uniref:Uncharacterized protein n=1 Tax=Polyplax serrata TaxID=468196 RepID=A0AAN8SF38_POLSC